MNWKEMYVGQRVIFREWEDMLKEFGESLGGAIRTPFVSFTRSMASYCGREYQVYELRSRITNRGGVYKETAIVDLCNLDGDPLVEMYTFTAEMFDPVDDREMMCDVSPGQLASILFKST